MSTSGSETKSSPPTAAPPAPTPTTKFAAAVTNPTPAVELYVAIRRGRVLVLGAIMVSVLLGIVFTLREGQELWQFNGSEKTTEQQEKMLDDYNSYSANVATVFGTPVEMFVSAAVQVILLRFLTRSITQAEPSWKLNVVSVAAGAVTVYLISNGFNAINVQFRERGIDAVISPEDLSMAFNVSVPGLSTNATHSFPETQARNPITNTMLRNAVLPRVVNQQPHCFNLVGEISPPTTAVEYGFTQRDWQSRVLQESLPAKQLRVLATRKNVTLADGATAADLPMNASLAADLYIYGMSLMVISFDMGSHYLNNTEIRQRYPEMTAENTTGTTIAYPKAAANKTLAKVVGLLPSDASDETAQRAFFLKSSGSGLFSQLAATGNMATNATGSPVNLTFSNVQLTDTIAFDSITFEFEIDPMMMTRSSTLGNATRYMEMGNSDVCGAVPGQCLVKKALFGHDTLEYDPPAQIQAFAQCLNGAGTDEMQAWGFQFGHPYRIPCEQASKTSMLTFSIGKRVTVDALTLGHGLTGYVSNSSASGMQSSTGTNVATNPRKFFTVTIGRLSWKWTDLTSAFGASCAGGNTSDCLGLQFPLANSSTSTTEQKIVAGANTLSVSTMSPFNKELIFKPRMLPLALIREPTMRNADAMYAGPNYGSRAEAEAGDVLLSHNIKMRNWTVDSSLTDPNNCFAQREERVNSTLNNHLYNEHGLQATYTAAMFILFENAVVQDVIRLDNNATTLNFKNNVRHVAVWLSVPTKSAWLTLAGCVLLVIGLVAALVQSVSLSKAQNDSLTKITAPHVIARVMLDEGQFPPLLLHRRIAGLGGTVAHREVDQFAIESIGLQPLDDGKDRLAVV